MQEYVSTQGSQVCADFVLNYTTQFTTEQVFKSNDKLLNWVHEVEKRNGLVIVIKTSDYGGGKKRPRMYLACERSDQYRATKKLKHDGNNTSRITGTKKCGCPFDMRAHRSAVLIDQSVHLEKHEYGPLPGQEENQVKRYPPQQCQAYHNLQLVFGFDSDFDWHWEYHILPKLDHDLDHDLDLVLAHALVPVHGLHQIHNVVYLKQLRRMCKEGIRCVYTEALQKMGLQFIEAQEEIGPITASSKEEAKGLFLKSVLVSLKELS
ncbi:unnamed protein product [Camellia sinensis]